MNTAEKIILTDTNVIFDLNTAELLEEFLKLGNVYISDFVKNREIKETTKNIHLINKFNVFKETSEQIIEVIKVNQSHRGLSIYDVTNFILAKDYDCVLATGDKLLRNLAEQNKIKVIGIIGIIDFLYEKGIIDFKKRREALIRLKNCPRRRLPINELEKRIEEIYVNISK